MLPFREFGTDHTGPVFLLLHFFGGSHREWQGVIEHIASHHRVLAADMPGFGEAATLTGFSVQDMAARILEVVQYLAPAPVILVGHSMSGKAAMVVAADPPPNLLGLVLVAPSPLAGEPMSDADRDTMRIANTTRERAETFTRAGFAKTPSQAIFEIAVSDVLRASDDAFHAWPDSGTREDWSERVQRFGVKAMLLVGDRDKAIEPALQQRETLPLVTASGGRMHLFAGCAHLLPYEAPAEVAQRLLAFAQELS